RPGDAPEIELLPVASRGGRLRYAAILGREGRYQLHLLADTPVSYKLTARDPSVPIEWGGDVVGSLPVSGAAFYRFKAAPGQLNELEVGGRGQGSVKPGAMDFWSFAGQEGKTIFLSVRSAAFEPSVSLRSPDGVQLVTDNKGTAATGSLFAVTLPKTGRYTVWI